MRFPHKKVLPVLSSVTTRWKSACFGREVGLLPIRPITGRLWPFPASSARSPIGVSYEALSPSGGENHGITMFRFNDRIDLAPAFTPAVVFVHVLLAALNEHPDCVPFGFGLSASLAGLV